MNPAEPAASTAPVRRRDRVAALRPAYQAELAQGLTRFFMPRRETCPWCGHAHLSLHLHTRDLLQHKPGRFRLDRCDDCGHVFQNPQLSPSGLEFYYRDFYDGLGEAQMAQIFAGAHKSYRNRAESLRPYDAAPATWLDVGCGHGHFCETAREVFAATDFHGLDFSDGARIAERLGRISRGYSGSFVELASGVAGHYAVVSMFHYLEHSIAPERDLAAAYTALAPGGHLVIEVPNPECRFATLFGKWWGPWLQPQHLHFIPLASLRERLTALGFEVLAVQHRAPHIPVDLVTAGWLMLKSLAPKDNLPWLAEPGVLKNLVRVTLFTLAAPLLFAAALVDALAIKPFAERGRLSNTYRVIARRA